MKTLLGYMQGMGDFLAIFDSISGWSWGWIAASLVLAFVIESWPHLRHSYWQWRIDRLLRREGEVHLDELRDLQWRQGEEPGQFDVLRVLSASAQMALQLAVPVVFVDAVSADDLALAPAAVAAAFFFARGRGDIREQEEDAREEPGPNIYPREAKIGLAVAIVLSLGLVLYITQVMHPG